MKLNTATLALSLSLSSLVSAGLSSSGGLALGGVHRHKARSLDVSSAASLTRRQSNANGSGGGGDNGGGGGGGGNNQGGGNAAAEDPQTSLTLDPSQVQPGLALDGQQVPAANQVASATSVNNFINFCLTRADLPLTNGAQVKTGSCNNVPMGVIGAQAKAPTSKFINPPNFATIQSNTDFTVQMAINNLVTGNFVNAQSNYFAAPQNTDNNGIIIGHSHVVIEQIDKLDSTTVTNSQNFAFFKGFNEAAVNGILSADVTGGLPAGVYKMSSINSASNHQPVLIGVAQHGSLDDAVYFVSRVGRLRTPTRTR
ncbi:hypothetical protein BCR35DRAFT_346581 [Leucosporidium creatinivorum]|uniref:Uncharacterized protein n=1 Tax=Leucosporidium creatinivorum TaxID=106004 RepID=A0A1Y2FYG9_9BASI|nr:hypothetical protein BCR35DRAFT_346581 [Leucosporidium creatinivorum]